MKVNDEKDLREVREAFDAYEAALLSNDVPKLEAFFWDSTLATRFGVGEQLYGYGEIVRFRRNRKLNFSFRNPIQLEITTFGNNAASVMYEYISDMDGIERHGRQSQTWIRFEEEWKIVSAHISYLPLACAIGASFSLLGLSPEREWQSRILSDFETTALLAGPLMEFSIPEEIEPASVFEP